MQLHNNYLRIFYILHFMRIAYCVCVELARFYFLNLSVNYMVKCFLIAFEIFILIRLTRTLRMKHERNFYKEDGISLTGSSIIKIILGILFEGFLNSILSVSGLKSEGRCPFFINEVSVILDKFSSYLCSQRTLEIYKRTLINDYIIMGYSLQMRI